MPEILKMANRSCDKKESEYVKFTNQGGAPLSTEAEC